MPPLGGAKCEDVVTFLKKDRLTPDHTASEVKKPQIDPSENLECDLCHADLSRKASHSETEQVNIKEHYMAHCPAIPGPKVKERFSRKEILERIASLSLLKKVSNLSKNTDVQDAFVFRGTEEDASSSNRDGLQRSVAEPPD